MFDVNAQCSAYSRQRYPRPKQQHQTAQVRCKSTPGISGPRTLRPNRYQHATTVGYRPTRPKRGGAS